MFFFRGNVYNVFLQREMFFNVFLQRECFLMFFFRGNVSAFTSARLAVRSAMLAGSSTASSMVNIISLCICHHFNRTMLWICICFVTLPLIAFLGYFMRGSALKQRVFTRLTTDPQCHHLFSPSIWNSSYSIPLSHGHV